MNGYTEIPLHLPKAAMRESCLRVHPPNNSCICSGADYMNPTARGNALEGWPGTVLDWTRLFDCQPLLGLGPGVARESSAARSVCSAD